MPKAKFKRDGKVKPKSVKARVKLSGKRELSRMGKKQKKGHAGTAVEYITRTRAIKKLQITLKDFRRLCILKGIYPRDPPRKTAGSGNTYYHYKDIAYLAHEPLLVKFRDFKVFMKKVRKAANRHELDAARRLYAQKPVYTLDHLLKERYPSFTDALGDLDDALSLVCLFAALPSLHYIKTERTALAKRLAREWYYYVARSRSLRKVMLSVKGIYYQAEVKGVAVTWLQPWTFAQHMPTDVDYKVMLTFLEFYEALLKFTLYKLYVSGLGLAYPPAIRADVEASTGGASLAAVEAFAPAAGGAAAAAAPAAAASSSAAAAAPAAPASGEDAKRLASLKDKLRSLAADPKAMGDGTGAPVTTAHFSYSGGRSKKVAHPKFAGAEGSAYAGAGPDAVPASMFDFVDAAEAAAAAAEEADGADDAATAALAADFAASPEAAALLEKARKTRQLQRLFSGHTFFFGREVPREAFEFMVVSFGGRVGWDGPGSPFPASHPGITHHVIDRPLPPTFTPVPGREYVQPQWVADSINARLPLPVAKYAPGATLPPHLSPFVDDVKEGYIPAYRVELERLRSAAAVTGRLADVIDAATAEAVASAGAAAAAAGKTGRLGQGDAGKRDAVGDDEDEDDSDEEDDDEEDEEEDDEEEDSEDEDDDEDEEEEEDAGASLPASKLSKLEEERRLLAASMLSANKRALYDRVVASAGRKATAVAALASKAAAAAAAGNAGTGKAAGAPAAAPAAGTKRPAASAPSTAGAPAAKKAKK